MGRVGQWCSPEAALERFDARADHNPQQSEMTSAPSKVGSRTGAPTVGFSGSSKTFRSGPQSDSPGHDSSPRHLKPGVLISSTGLSLMLHLKGYVTLLWSTGIGLFETPKAYCGQGGE